MSTWIPFPDIPVRTENHSLVLLDLVRALTRNTTISVNELARTHSVHHSTVRRLARQAGLSLVKKGKVGSQVTDPQGHYPKLGDNRPKARQKPRKPQNPDTEAQRHAEAFRDEYPAVNGASWKWNERFFKACLDRFEKGVAAARDFERFIEVTKSYIQALENGDEDPKFQFQPPYWVHKARKGEEKERWPDDTWQAEKFDPESKAHSQCPKCKGGGMVKLEDEKWVVCECQNWQGRKS